MNKFLYLTFFYWLIFSLEGFCQPVLNYLGIEHGLSNNAVTSIYQDKNGFMWFGTYDGLNQYDGYTFKTFKNQLKDSTSLINNWIVTIQGDDKCNIWVGTKQGLSIYSQVKDQFSSVYYRDLSKKSYLKVSSAINDLQIDEKGNMLIATGGKGLMLVSKGEKYATQIPIHTKATGEVNYHVQAIQLNKNKVWVFIQGEGIYDFNLTSKKLTLITNFVRDSKCLLVDNDQNLWVGNEYGLFKFHSKTKVVSSYYQGKGALSNSSIQSLSLDNEGRVWVSTDGGGINIINNKDNSIQYILPSENKGSLTSGAVDAVYEDTDGRMWIGTLRGGINIIDKNRNKFTTISHTPYNKNSLINNFILSFCEDKNGAIWIGTDGGGLSVWDRENNKFSNYFHQAGNSTSISNNNVSAIIKDFNDDIWIATYGGGINRYNYQNNSFSRYNCLNATQTYSNRNIWSLFEDSKRNLWAGSLSNGPLYLFNRTSDRFEIFDEKLIDIITIAEDRNKQLWVGNFHSLIKVDSKGKQHQVYEIGFAVRGITDDEKGNLWIATEGGGLLLFDVKTGRYTAFSEKDGLPSNTILNILEDKSGDFWLSTFNGLSLFNPKKNSFKNFYVADGLQSNQFNYNAALKLKSGEFLFGGIKGFNIFNPQSLNINESNPVLFITGLKINNQSYQRDPSFKNKQSLYNLTSLTLPYDKAIISLEFVAIDYSSSEKISYAYSLEGWDKGWNFSGRNRIANYSKIREGTYYLKIKSTNSEGIWLNNDKVLKIIVLPPWWRTWWAYSVYIFGFIGLVYAYLLHQRKQEKLKYQIQLANLEVEKEKDLNEKKLSFFTHVSHEFRTPLTLIINPIKEFINDKSGQTDPKELIVIYRNARRLLSLVDQLLHFRKSDMDELKLSKVNIAAFSKEVYLCFKQQARIKGISFDFICENEEILIYIDKEKIEIALFNLLSNAIKFTPVGGYVKFIVVEEESKVKIDIEDSGVGISESIGKTIFEKFYQVTRKDNKSGFGIGLYLVKTFVENHFGNISYISEVGKGTIFNMVLLKGKAHFKGQKIHEDIGDSTVFVEELLEETEPVLEIENDAADEIEILSEKSSMLLVDDNDEIRNYLKRIFQSQYIIYEADSAEKALQLVPEYLPDVIITDVMMGEMSGVELCAKIKEDPALNHIPVVLLTSSSSPEIKLKGIEDGADDFITKPFNKDILIARISNLLKSKNNLQHYFYNQITFKTDNSKVSTEYKEFLEKCIAITEKNIDNPEFNIQVLADEIGLSYSSLYKRVKSISGKSVNEFIRFIKLRKAAELFINTDCNVSECAFQCGFNDMKYFREQFNKLFGINPSEYIKKYRQPFQKSYKLNNKSTK